MVAEPFASWHAAVRAFREQSCALIQFGILGMSAPFHQRVLKIHLLEIAGIPLNDAKARLLPGLICNNSPREKASSKLAGIRVPAS